jgi:hypothetical protein
MADVFLSYAREDRARAEQVAKGLEGAGIEVFWDSEIPPGQTWADYIEAKLTQCKALIVLWSEHSTKSQWVREEARMGRDKGVLIPAMIDASQSPFGFGEVQAANLSTWTGDANHPDWRRFLEAVRAAAGRDAPPRPQPAMSAPPRAHAPPAAPPREEKKGGGVPAWAWGIGGVVATIIVLGLIGMNMDTQPTAPAQTPVQAAATQPTAPVAGDQNPQAIILAQLQQAQAQLAQQGFQQVGQPFSGSLAQGQTWNVPVEMHPGYEYRVLGVCDRDCADLDLVLYDPNGAALTQDRETTSQPIIGIAPTYSANYTIQVQMYNCTVAPCYYALALYGRVS